MAPSAYHWPHWKQLNNLPPNVTSSLGACLDGYKWKEGDTISYKNTRYEFRRFEYELYTPEARAMMKQWAREYDARTHSTNT